MNLSTHVANAVSRVLELEKQGTNELAARKCRLCHCVLNDALSVDIIEFEESVTSLLQQGSLFGVADGEISHRFAKEGKRCKRRHSRD